MAWRRAVSKTEALHKAAVFGQTEETITCQSNQILLPTPVQPSTSILPQDHLNNLIMSSSQAKE